MTCFLSSFTRLSSHLQTLMFRTRLVSFRATSPLSCFRVLQQLGILRKSSQALVSVG